MMDLNQRLSDDFPLWELVQSEVAQRHSRLVEQQENPPEAIIASLQRLCNRSLQPIRDALAIPILVNSGWRCDEVNEIVGGSSASAHKYGNAADVTAGTGLGAIQAFREIDEYITSVTGRLPRLSVNANYYLFMYIGLHLDQLDVDQVIHEYGHGYGNPAWIHVSSSAEKDRRQMLVTGRYVDTPKRYRLLTVEDAAYFGVS